MLFKDALNKCVNDMWCSLVLLSEKHLGKNTFLTESPYTKSKGPISGIVDHSKGKRLVMISYLGDNNFSQVELPFQINPLSKDWEAKTFIPDLNIGKFQLKGITWNLDGNGNLVPEDLEKLKFLMREAQDKNFSIEKYIEENYDLQEFSKKDQDDILNAQSYFKEDY